MQKSKPQLSKQELTTTSEAAPSISYESFEATRMSSSFMDGHHGTYWTPDKSRFLYQKPCHRVNTPQESYEALAFLRDATKNGILYPQTQWASYVDREDHYQLFAITPGLIDYGDAQRNPAPGHQALKRIPPNLDGLFDKDSHILGWYRRLEPNFDPNVAPDPYSATLLLNPFEASHADNWGWDEHGILFPIDVEVIEVAGPSRQSEIVHNWYLNHYPAAQSIA